MWNSVDNLCTANVERFIIQGEIGAFNNVNLFFYGVFDIKNAKNIDLF